MGSCCAHVQSTNRLFSFFSKRYRRRFEKKGFEPVQKKLIEGIKQAGITDATILEIGSGVGHLHQTLLEAGASSAIGVDIAAGMLVEARKWAADRGLTERTQYIEGDFVAVADTIDTADITILDKVVCCYPDVDGLVHASLSRTRRVYALTYPQNRWFLRWGSRVMSGLFWLVRIQYRSYVHDPRLIEQWANEAGFTRRYNETTGFWRVEVYVRD